MTDKNISISAVDAAIQKAVARKAAKVASGEITAKPAKAPKAEKAPAKPRVTDEEKAARDAAREMERAAKKATRDAARAVKLAERNANRKPAHLAKVERAAEKLGALGQASLLLFNEATANLTNTELASLAAHIIHFNRAKSTERAADVKLTPGQTVNIVSGDPRFVGKTGTVSKAQRIRAYVTVEGFAKPHYCFTSDLEVVEAESVSATG